VNRIIGTGVLLRFSGLFGLIEYQRTGAQAKHYKDHQG
jgi:hypothetical protein